MINGGKIGQTEDGSRHGRCEMFPLTDSSMLLLALLVIAFLGLGFMVLMGVLVCRIFDRNHQPCERQSHTPTSQQPDAGQADRLGTNIGIWGLALAFTAIAQSQYLAGRSIGAIVLYTFAGIMLLLGFPQIRRVIRTRQVRWFVYGFVAVLAVLAIIDGFNA